MDNAATTSTSPEVISAMLPFFTEYYGNPSSVYNFAQKSRMAIEEAREIIADSIGAADRKSTRLNSSHIPISWRC